ncbi:MAG TPA: hypothetical protein VM940_09915 [Chthoniobacterales bacterium]|nr:hypothetical protein [Chthoniobacterales bacterium]
MIERAASGKSSSQRPAWRGYYWGGIVTLFAWAAWQRFSLPFHPIADPDTWGYLAPALRKLLGFDFGHTYGRNFVYPGFVYLLLRGFGDFRAVVVAQHLLGLAAGGMLLLTWRRVSLFVRDSRLSSAGHDGLGLAAATIFLLAGEPIRLEMQLRPEGICAFVISLNLYCAIQFMIACFVEKRGRAVVIYGIASVFTSVLLGSLRPSFVLSAIVALLPVGFFFFCRGRAWQKIALGSGAALSAFVLLLPEHLLSRHDEARQTLLPTILFLFNADLIRDQMAEDLQRGANVPYPRDLVERVHEALGTEMPKSSAASPGLFWSLGFDPDYLMYTEGSIDAQLRREFDNDVPALSGFYRFYYWRIWREKPLRAARKIARQMAIFYGPMCPAYNRDKSLHLANKYAHGAASLGAKPYPETWSAYPPAVEFMRRLELLARNAPALRQPAPIRITLSVLSGMYLPMLWGTAALSVVLLFQHRHRRRLGPLAALVLFVYAYNAACCLEVAIVHSLEVRRYLIVQMFFCLLAQFLALRLLCETVLKKRAATASS